MEKRISSGVKGLDDLIEGGIVEKSAVLIIGGCGSGKSTLAMQFLVNGAQNGIPGLYVSFEEEPGRIKKFMGRHGWDIDSLEKKKKLRILRIDPQEMMNIIRQEYGVIVDAINDIGAKLVVLDSLTVLEAMFEGEFTKRQGLLKLIAWLQKTECTTLMIYESEQSPVDYRNQSIAEFLVDGVIVLYTIRQSDTRLRALEIVKMRGTEMKNNIVPYTISNGITLKPKQMIFGGVK